MKRFSLITLIAILALTSLACSVTVNPPNVRTRTGSTQTFQVNEPAPSGDARLEISMGAGRLDLVGGGDGLVTGEIRYNVEDIAPEVERSGGNVRVFQTDEGFPATIGTDVINEWKLRLGDTPTDLTVNAGAYEGTLDLSGVPLTRLQINDGASKSTVIFKETNPVPMSSLDYKTGASQVTLQGLGFANFKEMTFGGGAGSYTLDFAGELQQDCLVRASSGVSAIQIIIPAGTRADVKVTGSLNNVETRGTWTSSQDRYQTTGEGPLLTIEVDMGVGSLELIQR